MRDIQVDIKKRLKQREDIFLRRLMGMLAKMTKADGADYRCLGHDPQGQRDVMIFCPSVVDL